MKRYTIFLPLYAAFAPSERVNSSDARATTSEIDCSLFGGVGGVGFDMGGNSGKVFTMCWAKLKGKGNRKQNDVGL